MFINAQSLIYFGDMREGDREVTQQESDDYYAARADNRTKWNARAQEKARVTINQARQAVANMIAKRSEADQTQASLRALHAQLLALIPSVNLSASTDETNAFNTLWAAYVPLVSAFPAAIRAEYKLEFELLTKAIV